MVARMRICWIDGLTPTAVRGFDFATHMGSPNDGRASRIIPLVMHGAFPSVLRNIWR